MKNKIVLFTLSLITLIIVIGCVSLFLYRFYLTDYDCWLANDPIVCQKIKDGQK